MTTPDSVVGVSTNRDRSVLQSHRRSGVIFNELNCGVDTRVDLVTSQVQAPSDSALEHFDDFVHDHVMFADALSVLARATELNAFFSRHLHATDVRVR
ncbi:hypothetical protein D3C86_1675880 [compost metagenome]